MEELKMAVELLGGAGSLALWALVVIYLYKVVIIGSIYGTIRFIVIKIHDWLVTPKTIQLRIGTTIVDDATALALQVQISRLSERGYLHMDGVQKLREALDATGV